MLIARIARVVGFRTAVLLVVLGLAGFAPPASAESSVGFAFVRVPDPQGPPLNVGIWYPSSGPVAQMNLGVFNQVVALGGPVAGDKSPLILMSHGNGGWFGSHYDTALALARAGFVVAALSHTGDTYDDQSRALDVADRPRQLKLLADYMLQAWPAAGRLDSARVGAFGFSSGGFAVLVTTGGEPDLGLMAGHCAAHPDYYDCRLVRGRAPAPAVQAWTHDPRVKAAVIAAPALGFTFGRAGLAGVRVPVQLWRAGADQILPHPDYAEAVRRALPRAPQMHVVKHAGHFAFLAPCNEAMMRQAPDVCRDDPRFDRARFHAAFNAAVVKFFRQSLAAR